MMSNKTHLYAEGKALLVNIKTNLNWGNKRTKGYTNIRPKVSFEQPLSPDWVSGFTSGDGSFAITIMKHLPNKTSYRVRVKFNLTQHMRDKDLMMYFSTFFGCGTTYLNRETYSYNVYNLYDNSTKIRGFFTKYPLQGVKHQQFCLWLEVIDMMNKQEHNTQEGLNRIMMLKNKLK